MEREATNASSTSTSVNCKQLSAPWRICSIIVACLCIVIFALSISTVFVPWTVYHVSMDGGGGGGSSLEDLLYVAVGNDSTVYKLHDDWPQMFYTRRRHLDKVCFNQMDAATWRQSFGREPKLCGKNGAKCYCLSNEEFETPTNVSSHRQADQVKSQQRLLAACLGLMIIVIILSFCIFVPAVKFNVSPKLLGAATFICILVEECAIVAVVIMFCIVENIEDDIKQPPHNGFILNNPLLSTATTETRSDGFALCCSLVAFVTIKLVVYLCSWCTYLCCTDGCEGGSNKTDDVQLSTSSKT